VVSVISHLFTNIKRRLCVEANTGYFQSPDSPPKKEGRNTPTLTSGREAQVSKVLDVVSKRHNVPITSVAIAYVIQKVSLPTSTPQIATQFLSRHPTSSP
jgi:hypothetical protein